MSTSTSKILSYRLNQVDDIVTPYEDNKLYKKPPPIVPEIIKFRIVVHSLTQRPRQNVNEYVVANELYQLAETIIIVGVFKVKANASRLLGYKLTPMGVPDEWQAHSLLPAVYALVNTLAVDPRNVGRQWLGILVEIEMKTIEKIEVSKRKRFISVSDDVDDEEVEDYLIARTRIREGCAICLEKLSVEKDFVNLPCRHVYHWRCIVNSILRTSASCPLCRERLVDPAVVLYRLGEARFEGTG